MQRPRKECDKCGHALNREWRHDTNACFRCAKSGNIVRDCPRNMGQAGDHAHPRSNPQGTAAAEPLKRNMFYAFKVQRSRRSPLMWSQVCCMYSQHLFMVYLI